MTKEIYSFHLNNALGLAHQHNISRSVFVEGCIGSIVFYAVIFGFVIPVPMPGEMHSVFCALDEFGEFVAFRIGGGIDRGIAGSY